MADPIARACRLPELSTPAITAVDVAICRVARPDVDPDFVVEMLNSPIVRQHAEAASSGTTRKRITRKKLGKLRIPLPGLEDQRRTVVLISEIISALGEAERRAKD